MPQPGTIQDSPAGEVVIHGSKIINFPSAGNLVAEDIQFNKNTRTIDIPGTNGACAGAVHLAVRGVGQMTVQIKTFTTIISVGDGFSLPYLNSTNIPCIVTGVGISYTQNGATKIPVNFSELITGGGNPLSNSPIFDGNFTAATPIDIIRNEFSTLFGNNLPGYVYRQPYVQGVVNYSPLAIDTPCPADANAFLVEETPRQSMGGGTLVTWERVWATLPTVIGNYEMLDYPYQSLYSTGVSPNQVWAVNTVVLNRRARVTRSFYHTTSPQNITLFRVPKVYILNNVVKTLDGWFQRNPGELVIAADDELHWWWGNFWIRTERYITI